MRKIHFSHSLCNLTLNERKVYILPGTQSANRSDRHEPLGPVPSYRLEQMWERCFGILLVIRYHGGEHHRDAKVRQEDDRQGRDDRYRDGSLRILGLLSRRGHAIEADESVKARGRATYDARYAIRHESAGSELAVRLGALGLRFPIVHIS